MNADLELANLRVQRARLDVMAAMMGFAPAQPADQWSQLVAKYEQSGLSRVAAIQAAGKERPALYQAQSVPVEPRRARR